MASTDRKIYKIIQKSLSRGSKSLSPSDKNVTVPYKQLHHKSSGTLTNFEKFIKVKLVDAKANTNSQKRLNKQSERMYSFDKSLPIPTNSDQICITHESKRSEIRALSSERKATNHTNASILNLQTQLTQNTQHSSDLTTMDSFFRSRSQGKLNRDIKKIARLSVEAQNRTNEKSFYGKLTKQKSSQEKKESQEKIPKLSQINNFHCFLNNKAYLSPRPSTHELSKGVSLGQIRKELGISLTDRDIENNKSVSLIQKNGGKNGVESYHMKKSIYVNPHKITIPIRHFAQSIVHQEDQTSKEAAEISKESFSNVQVYDPSVQDGGISPNEHFIINKRQIQDSFEETTDKHSSLSVCQSFHDNETERALRSRSKDFIKLYSYSGLINSDRATSPLNSSRTYTRKKTSLFPSDLKKEYLPEWLEQRNDFKKACRGMLGKGRESVPNAVMKPSYNRTAEEIEIVATWLEKVKVFRMLPKPLIYSIVEKIKVRTYRRNQILCYQGDPGDCLYIVYNGIIRCLVDGVPVAHYKSGDSIGQTSLDSTQPRTATLLSTSTSIILRLEIEDYRLIMEYYSMKQKSEFKETLMRVRGFEEFSNNKIALISSHLQSKFYIKGEVIYHQDDSSEALFILKQGLVIIESNISLEKENLWPVGNQLWEKCTVVRNKKVSHVVKPFSFFGDMELIRNCDRLNTAVCGEDSHVLILNKRNFSDLFDSNELNLMKLFSEEQIYEDVDKMREEVIEEEKEKQKMKKIMIKAFTDHLGPLSSSELKKKNSRFEPAIDKLKQDYKIFLKRNTTAAVKVYEKVFTNNTG